MAIGPEHEQGSSVWERLRRRKVVQWGLAYTAGAWGFLQGLQYVSDAFAWPAELRQVAILALLIGLPIVVAIAWYHGDRGEQRVTRAELVIITLLFLLGGGTFWRYDRAHDRSTDPAVEAAAVQGRAILVDGRPSIAVLPFVNRSAKQDDAFFVDGIHDDILTQLTKIGAIRVIARTSVEQFRDTRMSTKEIGDKLGVTRVLEGGVQRAGNRVRISVQLVDAGTDAHLWAENYDRELTAANIFAIQSEVAAAIAGALKATLTAGEKARIDALPTQILAAWESYQLGRQSLAKRTSAGFDEAERRFQKAIELDPNFALAYAGLAESLAVRLDYTDAPRAATLERARAAVDAALKLDVELADAWASGGLIEWSGGHFARAEEMFRRAIDLSPNHAMALKFYGDMLFLLGRVDESVRYFELAATLDPLSAIIQVSLGEALAAQERYEAAAGRYRRAIEIDPLTPMAYRSLAGLAAYALDDFVTAVPLAEKAVALDPDNPISALFVAWLYLGLGDEASFDQLLRRAEERWPDVAAVNTSLAARDLQRGDRQGAERHAGYALQAEPRHEGALWLLGLIDYRAGHYAEAVARYRRAYPELFSAAPRIDLSNFSKAIDVVPALQRLGKPDQALALLAGSEKAMAKLTLLGGLGGLGGRAPYDARALALRGQKQKAFAALRAAEKAGWRFAGWRIVRDIDPAFDSIRNEPEFQAIFADIERDMARQRAALAARPKDAPLDLAQAH